MDTSSASGAVAQLSPIEARILGSLIEKATTTPDAYPLTLNNAVLACNQKTAREPTMQLNPGDVGHALRHMEVRGLVKSQYSSRSERYTHRFHQVFDLTPAQTCLMSLLLLRGAQTLHELLTRSERQHRFDNIDDVKHALDRLAEREPSLIKRISRSSGQREDRYAHLLCGEPVISPSDTLATTYGGNEKSHHSSEALLARIEALEARIEVLEAAGATHVANTGND